MSNPNAAPHHDNVPRPTPQSEIVDPLKPPVSRRVRISTIVWGFVIMTLGLWLLTLAMGWWIDTELWLIVLACGAGVALITGSVTSMIRKPKSE